jgi:hypothetical protein
MSSPFLIDQRHVVWAGTREEALTALAAAWPGVARDPDVWCYECWWDAESASWCADLEGERIFIGPNTLSTSS